jgi:hypothetical protein
VQTPTVEFAHVSAGGDIKVELPHDSYSPLLHIRLLQSTLLPFVPEARDSQRDVEAFVVSEAARNGIPPFADLTDYVRLNPGDDEIRAYESQVTSWLTVAIFNLTSRHEYETCIARGIFLTFEVTNSGQLPAERVTVELRFPAELSVNKYISRGEDPPEPPKPPRRVLDKFQATASRVMRFPEPWYSSRASQEPAVAAMISGIELFGSREATDEAQVFRAFKPRLEHGTSFKTRPIRVSFGYGSVRAFEIYYVLHASNQPNDSRGTIPLMFEQDERDGSPTEPANG